MKTMIPFALFCLVLVACQQTGNVVTDQEITIGGLFALTGYGAQWGEAEQAAVQLAIAEANAQGGINGKHVVLVSEDTHTEPKNALAAYNKLVTVDKTDIIIGPTWEASAAAVIPQAAHDGVFVISPSSYDTVYNTDADTVFSTYPPFAYQFGPLIQYATENDINKFAVISNNEVFSKRMGDIFSEQAKEHDWTIVESYSLPLDTLDYRVALLKVRESTAQVIYAPMEGDQLGRLVKQAKELGMTLPIYSVDSVEHDADFNAYGDVTTGVLFPSAVAGPAYDEFSAKYRALYGLEPITVSAAYAYDATTLVIDALKQGATTPDEIAAYLHSVENFRGASGVLTFTDAGVINSKEFVLKVIGEN